MEDLAEDNDSIEEISDNRPAEEIALTVKRRKGTTKISTEKTSQKVSPYFVLKDSKYHCRVADCKTKLTRDGIYYRKRHLLQKHESIYKDLFREEVDYKIQQYIDAFEVMQNAVELVTVNGYPFSLLNKPAFRKLIAPGLNRLAENGIIITVNRKEIGLQIKSTSLMIHKMIASELKNRMFSIMFDITTKSTLSVLGINASYMINDVVVCRSLGVIQLTERHFGTNIAPMIEQILESYGVHLKQLFASTTDNGSNMLKTTRILNHLVNGQSVSSDDENDNNNQSEMEIGDETNFEFIPPIGDENIADAEDDDITVHTQSFIEIVNNMTQDLTLRNNYLFLINLVNCCSHTLQLAVSEAIKQSSAWRVLNRTRAMCKSLRNQVVNIEFRKLSPKTALPPLDTVTRWNSEYIMVIFVIIEFSS